MKTWGTGWRSWLRHCATSWKVAGSIPSSVTGIFIDIILQIALWPWGWLRLWQKWVPGGKGGQCVRQLTTFMCRLSWNLGASTAWNPQGLFRPVMGLLYLFCWIPTYIYDHISLSFPRNKKYFKGSRENQNTHFRFSNVFRKSCRLWDNVEKYSRAGQATHKNMAHPHLRKTHYFSTTTTVPRTRLNITLYVHCLCCLLRCT